MSADPQQMAYFRYSVIAPLLADEPDRTLKERIEELAERMWVAPPGDRLKRLGFGTIEHWLYDYRRGGLEALQGQPRRDAGSFRGIDEQLAETLDDIIAKHPKLRTHAIIDHLRRQEKLPDPPPSQSTLYRYIKSRRTTAPAKSEGKERRSFEAPYAGYLWQADIMYGPHLAVTLPNGRTRKQQAYLIAIIDDHSRLLCHGEFYLRQDLAAWLCCLETAIRKRGIPKKLYCDNGQVFVSQHVKKIAAKLGMEVRHTAVRDAAAKGKIERMFLRCRRSFLEPLLELSDSPLTLDKLNAAFFEWAESEYNHREHSAFSDTPIRRFMESSSHLRTLADDERMLFHISCERRVKKDGTFSLNGTRFETISALVGCKITVSYDLREPEQVHVHWLERYHGKANLLDVKANNRRLRRNDDNDGEQTHA
jgi:putative transposase